MKQINQRWYLHGDQKQENKNLYYCRKCDYLFDEEHFAIHEQGTTRERNHFKYLMGLKSWKATKSQLYGFFRSNDAFNLFG